VSPLGSILIGAIAGVVVVLAIDLMEYVRVDDPIGAVAVHGFCGIWGTLSLGLFATGEFGAAGPLGADNSAPVVGLFYGGGTAQLIGQLIGSAAVTVATLVCGLALMYAVKATGTLRIKREHELEGLDISEHGGPAYPELLGGSTGYHAAGDAPVSAPSGGAAVPAK
jgi:Amt family ammonium transporter